MKKSKKGFTLIELLAVIVILAIIALIAVPVIMNILNKSNKSVFRDTAYGIINAGELYYAEQQLDLNGMSENKTFDLSKDVNTEDGIQLKGEIPSGKVSVTTEGEVAISIHNGRYYAKKDYDKSEVEVYEIMYYSTLKEAVNDVNNDKIGEKAIADQHNAVAGVYTNNENEVSVVLLKDTTETSSSIPVSTDMIINLGGNTLTFADVDVGVDIISGDVTIDGRLYGSKIEATSTTNVFCIRAAKDSNSNVSIIGGNYIVTTTGTNTITVGIVANNTSKVEIYDAIIKANGGSSTTRGIGANSGSILIVSDSDIIVDGKSTADVSIYNAGTATVSNCNMITNSTATAYNISNHGLMTISDVDIIATSSTGKAYGISNANGSTCTIFDSSIKALSNYTYDDGKYSATSNGIANSGTLTINNSYVMGTHSGMSNVGTLYVDGGTYEGYGHGGIYFAGSGTTAFVSNATIRECDMPEGYTQNAGDNNAGFYIGGAAGNDNIKVYMNNNNIYGSSQPIVLRGSSGEQNNSLYISNSTINTNANIRIDNNTHRLYIGAGNNFTAANTNLPSAVEPTTDVYTRENVENKW